MEAEASVATINCRRQPTINQNIHGYIHGEVNTGTEHFGFVEFGPKCGEIYDMHSEPIGQFAGIGISISCLIFSPFLLFECGICD